MKYGRSLSFCVLDILRGKVKLDDLGAIVASTLIRDENDLKEVFNSYMESYWYEYDKEKVWELVKHLWDIGKIYQPRLNKSVGQALYKFSIWCDSFSEAYESLEEI